MYNELLCLYKHPFTLTRLGRNADGGYVVPKELFATNSALISCGISNEISFEEAYLKMNPYARIYAYDGTIDAFPSNNKLNFAWEKLNIASTDTATTISLNTIFEKYKLTNVCMKMDIEGAEYDAFSAITQDKLVNIDCLVLEVHDIQYRTAEFTKLMTKLSNFMILIHRHDNNCNTYFNAENTTFANVYELTFVNRRFVLTLEKNYITLPLPNLDFNNH